MAYPVKWFRSDMRAAPTRNGTPGSMLAQYIACLITGFGDTPMISGSVTDNKATLVFGTGLTFFKDSIVLIQNATPSALNGEHIVKISGDNTITIDVLAPDGPIGGSVNVKYAPIGGWTMPFSGPNVGVFRSLHPESLGFFFRVTDTNATYGCVSGIESMTSLTQASGFFPSATSTPLIGNVGLQRWKSHEANTSMRHWFLIGDSRGFYDFHRHYIVGAPTSPADYPYQEHYCGDLLPYGNTVDNYACLVNGTYSTVYNVGSNSNQAYNEPAVAIANTMVDYALPRNLAGDAGNFKRGRSTFTSPAPAHYSGSGWVPYTGTRRKLTLTPPRIIDDEYNVRGYVPGFFCSEQNITGIPFTNFGVYDGTHEFFGRRMMAIMAASNTAQSAIGANQSYIFLDLHGPWR